MKKQLLSIVALVTVSSAIAQVPSADWATNQNAVYPTSVANKGVKFMDAVDANVCWVIGTDYAQPSRNYNWYSRTIDGGNTFAGGNVFSDTNTYVIANMEALDANTAWVCSYMKAAQGMGAIHRTTNGGASWVNMSAAGMYTNAASFANWITFLTPSVAIANGDPVNGEFELWRTTDGGNTWNLTPGSAIPDPLSANEFAIVNLYAKVGSSNLWFGTNGNRMFRTTDAGLTYSVSSVGPVTNTITEIAFSSPLNGVCYMVNSGATLELWNTFDGGVTWSQVTPTPANLGFFDVTAIPGTGYLVSYGAGNLNELISYSIDNGVTWTDWGSTAIPYITGDFVDGTTGWAGSLDFIGTTANFTDIWKYTGTPISGTVSPSAAFSLPATLCLSGSSATVVPANSSVGSPALTYSWSVLPAGATISNSTDSIPTFDFSTGNTYTVTLVATNSIGSHTSSAIVNVIACSAPVATFSLPATACSNYSFTTGNTSTGAPAPSYFWSVSPSTNVTITPSPVASAPGIQIGTPGIYSITLLVSNASGTAQTTQTLNVTPCAPIAAFSIPEAVCFTDPIITFSTTNSTSHPAGASGSLSYTWSIVPNNGLSFSPNLFQPNVKVTITNTTISQYTVTLRARNASGTSTVTQVIMASECTGIEEEGSLAQQVSLFPNPAHNQVHITLPVSNDTYSVKLTNLLGSVIFEEKSIVGSTEKVSVNIANQPKGVYFLTVENKNEKVTKKFIVE